MQLSLAVRGRLADVIQYQVTGLPWNRMIWISERRDDAGKLTGRWHILPVTVLKHGESISWVKGSWVGDFESPEAVLRFLDEAFLQNQQYWQDIRY